MPMDRCGRKAITPSALKRSAAGSSGSLAVAEMPPRFVRILGV